LRNHFAIHGGEDADGKPIYHVADEIGRVTVEIRGTNIVQVRRHLNAPATQQENYILRMWAGSKGIGFGTRW
jgi:serine kinase of HPr protein (carbohydrate metabolism regulator)